MIVVVAMLPVQQPPVITHNDDWSPFSINTSKTQQYTRVSNLNQAAGYVTSLLLMLQNL